MISPKRRISASIAIVLAVGITPALSGCFGNPIESLVEQATGGQVDLGGKEIPEGFPSEVPLVAGDVQFGIAAGEGDSRGYNVTILAGAESPLKGIETELSDAGFEIQLQGSGSDGVGTIIFTSDAWAGGVIVAKTDDGYTANYTVAASGN
ncbi:hypothetical protein [Salinibacterium sp. TMP30]|uniref:hypothetical protein n=1 Tax=Salinibacterium sp. TMP30 TaxID=3138237 RepID=UPI003139940C